MTRSSQAAAPRSLLALFGYRFRDPALLDAALTHPSSTDPSQSDIRVRYQRLEFLGDAVWNLYVSDALVSLLPSASEGELTQRRSGLVSANALAEMAQRFGLAPLLILSKGEESTGGRQKTRVLASTFEAVIGAIYLDGGIEAIREVARTACLNTLAQESLTPDPKTALQQRAQALLHVTPRYRLIHRSGAPHAPMFEVEVIVGQSPVAGGKGRNRQEAERAAAREALRSWPDPSATISSSDDQTHY
jgi:ribonuclease-3